MSPLLTQTRTDHHRQRISRPSSKPSAEVLLGDLIICDDSCSSSESVIVKIYRTSYCHFVALFPNKKICNPLACINLKHYSPEVVQTDDDDSTYDVIILRPRSCDGTAVFFKVAKDNRVATDEWMSALTSVNRHPDNSPSKRHSLCDVPLLLPSVAEHDEEDG
ncbi:Uncharacterised protein g10186 [Pycnogonum litorale]